MKPLVLKPEVSWSGILHFDFFSMSFESPERSEGSGHVLSVAKKACGIVAANA
jgi:hypothetical protein